jgi:hypothetical protein
MTGVIANNRQHYVLHSLIGSHNVQEWAAPLFIFAFPLLCFLPLA